MVRVQLQCDVGGADGWVSIFSLYLQSPQIRSAQGHVPLSVHYGMKMELAVTFCNEPMKIRPIVGVFHILH